jgi:signal transduction histidine kinase
MVHRSPEETYGGADPRLLVLEAGAATALLVVSALGPARVASVLIAVAAALWLAPEMAGAVGISLPARSIADATGPVIVAVILVALCLRTGRVDARRDRPILAAVVVAVGAAAVAAVARLLVVDPFLQVDCWRACEHNPLLVLDGSWGAGVELVALVGAAGGALGAGALGLREHRLAPAAATADLAGWLLLGGLIAGLFVQPRGVTVATDDKAAVTVFVLVQLAALAWLAVLAWQAWRRWRLESRLAQLVDLLGNRSDPDMLVDSLREAVRDPGLRVAYWAPTHHRYVDIDGRVTAGAEPRPGERATTVVRHGQRVAAIVHSRRVDGHGLDRALGPALRLALENEQLRAAALAELAELERSRRRVVERGELERRRLERNLHDGAQQRAVSLALLVGMLARQPDARQTRSFRRAEALTRILVEELRRVARGIYPAVLSDAGLVGAVQDLAERSQDLPVAIDEFPTGRYPGTVESTAYLLVRAVIADARARGANTATVNGQHVDGTLRISVEDDATAPSELMSIEFADQVGALGGTMVNDGTPGRRRVEVVLPCGS